MDIRIRQPYSFTQLGRRTNQEDARWPDTDTPDVDRRVFVVCDGVGGQDKGEVASRTVADALGSAMAKSVGSHNSYDTDRFAADLNRAWEAFEKRAVKSQRGMATTMTALAIHAGGVLCAHMGDSRIYHIRPGVGILYRSDDHSLVNSLVHSGNITPDEARNHPQSNVITRCFSHVDRPAGRPAATVMEIRDLQPGDWFLMLTDGVLHCFDDNELCRLIDSGATDSEIAAAIAKGSENSPDNNTAVLFAIASVDGREQPEAVAETIPVPEAGAENTGDLPADNSATEKIIDREGISKEIRPKGTSPLSNFFKKFLS